MLSQRKLCHLTPEEISTSIKAWDLLHRKQQLGQKENVSK